MESRDAYLEEMEARLQKRDAEIESLKAEAETFERTTMFGIRKKIEDLEDKQTKLRARMAGIRTAAAWQEAKGGIEKAWDELTTAFDDAFQTLRGRGEDGTSPDR